MPTLEIANNLQQQLTKARQEIHNLRKKLNTLQHVHRKDIERIVKKLDNWQCTACKKREEKSELFDATSIPRKIEGIEFKPIGIINSGFPQKRGTPRQPTITMHDSTATLVLSKDVFTNPSHALQDLQQFSHLWIIFIFHKNIGHSKAKIAPPRLNGIRTGIFATRSPHRPCPIGLSLVKIEKIVENTIYFTGVDMVDQTPVLDIKPYIPHYDQPDILITPSHLSMQDSQQTVEVNTYLPPAQDIKVELLAKSTPSVLDSQDPLKLTEPVKSSPSSHPNKISIFMKKEDPDGEEAGPDDGLQQKNSESDKIRVPAWIEHSPVHKLTVNINDNALAQLISLGPELVDDRSRIISNVLREDPRSIYLRERWSGTFYTLRVVNLCVECKFNDVDHTVEITNIFQND